MQYGVCSANNVYYHLGTTYQITNIDLGGKNRKKEIVFVVVVVEEELASIIVKEMQHEL